MRTPKITCTGPDGVLQETTGMAQINGFTKDFHNQFVEQIYGGDLCGSLWRFDLSDPNDARMDGQRSCIRDRSRRGPAHDHGPADRGRLQERLQSLRVHRHGPTGDGATDGAATPSRDDGAVRDGAVAKMRHPQVHATLPLDARTITKPVNRDRRRDRGGAPDGRTTIAGRLRRAAREIVIDTRPT